MTTTDPTPDLPCLLTIAETAASLRMSKRFVERLIADGELPAVRLGKAVRIRHADLLALADRATVQRVGGRA